MPDKPHYSLLHHVLVLAHKISVMPTPILFVTLVTLVGSATWMWINASHDIVLGCLVGLGLAVFIAGDWMMLAWLPRAGRSFGPVGLTLLALAGLRWALTTLALFYTTPQWTWALVAVVNLAVTGNALDSLWAEPFRLGVTTLTIESPKLTGSPPLRVLHLSDLHLERITMRERKLLELVKELHPDLIVFTGDFLNLSFLDDPRAHAECREILSQLYAPLGVYAVTGSPAVDRPPIVDKLLDGLPLRRLHNQVESLAISSSGDPTLALVGVTCTHNERVDGAALERTMANVPNNPSCPFTLLLYHSPDLMPRAVRAGVDLYLCGHTHGGQIRLPLFGALLTSSRFWKRYEMGRYVEGNTTLYVSRGIGLEGMGAPRARLLCPPEIELWELRGLQKPSTPPIHRQGHPMFQLRSLRDKWPQWNR